MKVDGNSLAEVFHLERTPNFVASALTQSAITATHIVCTIEHNGMTAPIPRQDAFLVNLQLKTCPAHELWLDGTPAPTSWFEKGTVSIYDLQTNPVVYSVSSFELMAFFLPRAALDAITESQGSPRVDALDHNPGLGADDAVLAQLGATLLPAFSRKDETSQIFVDHVTTALAAHLCHAYAAVEPMRSANRLSIRQERRAKEILRAHLNGNVTIAELAQACGVPVGAFAGAFRNTTGVVPHRWLLQCRVACALDLMHRGSLSKSEIAAQAGFASPRHLQRILRAIASSQSN